MTIWRESPMASQKLERSAGRKGYYRRRLSASRAPFALTSMSAR